MSLTGIAAIAMMGIPFGATSGALPRWSSHGGPSRPPAPGSCSPATGASTLMPWQQPGPGSATPPPSCILSAHVRASCTRPRRGPGLRVSWNRLARTRRHNPRVISRSMSLGTPASRRAELTGQSARRIFEIAVTALSGWGAGPFGVAVLAGRDATDAFEGGAERVGGSIADLPGDR